MYVEVKVTAIASRETLCANWMIVQLMLATPERPYPSMKHGSDVSVTTRISPLLKFAYDPIQMPIMYVHPPFFYTVYM